MKQKILFFILFIGLCVQFSYGQLSTLPSYNVSSYKPYGWIYFNRHTTDVGDLFTTYKNSFFNQPGDSMELVRVWEDRLLNLDHYLYQQCYMGIPVEGCQFIEHANEDDMVYANGKICPDIYRIYEERTITSEEAFENLLEGDEYWEKYIKALDWIAEIPFDEYSIDDAIFAWEDPSWEAALKVETGDSNATYYPEGELVFGLTNFNNIQYNMDPSDYRLAWKFDIVCLFPDIHVEVYVDQGYRINF